MKYLQITTDQKATVIECTPLTSYDAINKGVGGYIEPVGLTPSLEMYVHEEGKLIGSPQNLIAQHYWNITYGYFTDIIVGNVVFTGGVDENGETNGLTDEQIEAILQDAGITEHETLVV